MLRRSKMYFYYEDYDGEVEKLMEQDEVEALLVMEEDEYEANFKDIQDNTDQSTYNVSNYHIISPPGARLIWVFLNEAKKRFRGWQEGDFFDFEMLRSYLRQFRRYTTLLIDLHPIMQEDFPELDGELITHILTTNPYNLEHGRKKIHTFDGEGKLFCSEIPIYNIMEAEIKIRKWLKMHPWCESCNKRHELPRGDNWPGGLVTRTHILNDLSKIVKLKVTVRQLERLIRETYFPQRINFLDTSHCYVWSKEKVDEWMSIHNYWLKYAYSSYVLDQQKIKARRIMSTITKQFGLLATHCK